jgi:putative transposase
VVVHSKTLAERIHQCPECFLEIGRDLNAAINIRNLAIAEGHPVIGEKPKIRSKKTRSPRYTSKKSLSGGCLQTEA